MKLSAALGITTLAMTLGLTMPAAACHRYGYSYSYAPAMPARPQYAAPRPAARSVAQAPQAAPAPQPQVLQITPVVNVTPGYQPGMAPVQPAPAAQAVAAAPAPAPAQATPAAFAETSAPPPPPSALPRNVEVVLTNNEQQPVAYTLNGTRYDMQPGHGQKLTSRPSWIVEFDRGGQFGTARYTLKEGTFSFVATERGWELVKQDDVPAPPSAGEAFGNIARSR